MDNQIITPITGVFSFDYNPCKDPCVIANAEDCLKIANIKKCLEDCDKKPLTDKEWLACRANCRISESQIRVNRRPTLFIATVQFTTNLNDISKYVTYRIGPQTSPIASSYPNFTVNGPIYSGYFCFRYWVTILYDDGTQCTQPQPIQWACSQ